LHINFECFLTLAQKNPKTTCQRVIDSMLLEKIKQMNSINWAGAPAPLRLSMKMMENEIVSRYSEKDLNNLRKNGFTLVPLDQRANLAQLENQYNVIYRNFSRNVHSTDYLEHLFVLNSEVLGD